MVAGTSYMSHSQLFSNKNLWNEKVAKEPQSSQIKIGATCFSNESNFWFLAPKEPMATLLCHCAVNKIPYDSSLMSQAAVMCFFLLHA